METKNHPLDAKKEKLEMKTMTKVWIDKQTKQLAKWKWKIEWENAREKSNLLVAGDLLEIYHNTRYVMAWEG